VSQNQKIDITRLIDEKKIDAFSIKLLIFSFIIFLFDGYDTGAIAFAAPDLLKAWHITNRAALGPVFSASLFGVLIGAPIFGYIGDRFGRKKAIIACCLTFGLFTWAVVLAGSLDDVFYLRFFAGIGIGGLLPNVIALNAEYAPKRYRATMIIVMFTGYPLGTGSPGLLTAWLVPQYGWTILFWIGGVVPIVAAVAVFLWMPESLKYLVVKYGRRAEAEVVALLARVKPGLSVAPDAQFLVPDESQFKGFSPQHLFRDGLAFITPLLWFCFAMNLMGYYFLISWMPTLLTTSKVLSSTSAALATTLLQVGGTLGSLALCRPMDVKGLAPVTVLFAIAVPTIALIGYASSSESLLMIVVFVAGFCVLGLQSGLNAMSGMIYPTAYRSNGSGWAFGIGRFGSVVGPIVGGFLVGRQLPLEQLFMFAAIPAAFGTVACFALMRLCLAKFGGYSLGQRDQLDSTLSHGAASGGNPSR
jgi:AAHS family 4-hydroxybenzoate transporter-like MFS transporter